MNAKTIFLTPEDAFIYMERYVNNGSPSGWTKLRSTSLETSPFTGKNKFPLLQFNDIDVNVIEIGEHNNIFDNNVNFAHPDSYCSEILQNSKRTLINSNVIVSPTSGGRTMYVRSENYSGFIKLTYDVNRIGRVDRQLKYEHCMSSYEVSSSLKKAIDDGKFKKTFSILLEKSAKVSRLVFNSKVYDWGTILRECTPYPYITNEKRCLVPGFSMFGTDFYSNVTEEDELLINQFIEMSGINPTEYLCNVIKITVDAWFEVLLNCAFILELHGQNCYYEINENYQVVRIVIKDMDSVDKDLSLARKLGLNDQWKSFPFECFYEDKPENYPWYYKIRPSYMYDFKLGTYLLEPMIQAVYKRYRIDTNIVYNTIKKYVRDNYWNKIPLGYFPLDGSWYDCDNSERKPGERRKYYQHNNPKFR